MSRDFFMLLLMIQKMTNYSSADKEIWKLLMVRQMKNLNDKGATLYLTSLRKMETVLNPEEIPSFEKINNWFSGETGWQIENVPGLIGVKEFFSLLANKKFCSSSWLRSYENLDYLEEPDMFHDIFGHIPLLTNPLFSAFAQKMGVLGVKHSEDEQCLKILQRLYWYTIEFGLIKENAICKPYGAGIISSYAETNRVFKNSNTILPFDLKEIMYKDFHTDKLQETYFSISSFEELFDSIQQLEVFFNIEKLELTGLN